MSIMRGTKLLPNSLCKRSASVCLRTEPNTRNPFEISTFAVPQPIPVETPVTTTSLLFAIALRPSGSAAGRLYRRPHSGCSIGDRRAAFLLYIIIESLFPRFADVERPTEAPADDGPFLL